MSWDKHISDYKKYLRIERGLSSNTYDAYLQDVAKLKNYVENNYPGTSPLKVTPQIIASFVMFIASRYEARTQARIISGVKSFYGYLLYAEKIKEDPTVLIESPKLGSKLPVVLTVDEIDSMINAIDLSKPEGHRNKAIIETLYGCGLRVSELVNLKISNVNFEEKYLRIFGKGSKERIVPINDRALSEIKIYLDHYRKKMFVKKGNEDILFLNRRGAKLTRFMINAIVRDLAEKAGINKNVTPHTFRHSFATHLIEGGADLRAVQEMLGHESILTTEIYTHLDRNYLRETIIEHHPRSKKDEL